MSGIRPDYRVIIDIIKPGSSVLDLGCGDGQLLYLLKTQKQCRVTGIEIDEKAIYHCMEKGVAVCHDDIDSSLEDFSDKRFDYVILNESLQQILSPEKVIQDALRVGKKVIVGIPNFCHTSARFQIFFQGIVPVTPWLPYKWHNTPNLRFLSLKDFRLFCQHRNIVIEQMRAIRGNMEVPIMTNLFGHTGIFLLTKG